jgi:hypothetical protein
MNQKLHHLHSLGVVHLTTLMGSREQEGGNV